MSRREVIDRIAQSASFACYGELIGFFGSIPFRDHIREDVLTHLIVLLFAIAGFLIPVREQRSPAGKPLQGLAECLLQADKLFIKHGLTKRQYAEMKKHCFHQHGIRT